MMNTDHDSGRVSVFLAIAFFAVLMIIGLSFDGARQLMAMQRAHNLAAEAARTGGQAIDEAAAIGGGPKVLDEAKARAAVDAYRAAAGVSGPPAEITGAPGNQSITVIVYLTYEPVMLSFFGWQAIEIHGESTAQPLTAEP